MHKGIKPNAHDGCTQEVYSDSTKAPKHGYIEKKKRQSILMNGNPTNFMDDPRV